MFAALTLPGILLTTPTLAAPRQKAGAATRAKTAAPGVLAYVHRGASAKGDFTRTLTLFPDGRVLLVSFDADANNNIQPATVQTGTWKRGNRTDRVSLSLTRQNEAPYKATIVMIGTPGDGGELSATGEVAKQYGAYGLTFAPRLANNAATAYDAKNNRTTVTATGVNPVPLDGVKNAQITRDGNDVLFWKNGGAGGSEDGGGLLYYFNTLTGLSRLLAKFEGPINPRRRNPPGVRPPGARRFLRERRNGQKTGVAVVDPLRERTMKQWTTPTCGAQRQQDHRQPEIRPPADRRAGPLFLTKRARRFLKSLRGLLNERLIESEFKRLRVLLNLRALFG
jgi:hypothetical protein